MEESHFPHREARENWTTRIAFILATLGFSAGIGFTLALVLMAAIRERLELVDIPRSMRGIPITFVVAGLMAIAFLGFSGLKLG